MIRGLYAAATGLAANQIQQDVTARNLSQANKIGFRRQVATFETFGRRDAHLGTNATRQTDFSVGDHHHTGRPLDVALTADGFFVIDGPNGPLYTRNGTFHTNAQGQLVTFDGFPVQGAGGPIIFPPAAESISILDDGTVVANGQTVGALRIVQFADNNALERTGNSLFQAPQGVQPQVGASEVRQGYREHSNGPMIAEMTNMIFGLRHYEASQRALRSISDAIELSTRPQG